jgi:hypothetical protein
MSKQEDRLDFFTKLIKKNRIFEQDEMKVIPLVESTLMYFSGIFCENSKIKRCKQSQNSICRVTNSNAGHWKRNSKAISYFVFRGDDGYWQLTDVVKDRLNELGIKYKTFSFQQHKDDIPYVPDTVETKSTETKKTSAKFLQYNHSSLIDWYKEFISLNNFRANDRDLQVIESLKINIPLNEFVSSFNEAQKNNRRPYFSSLVNKHASTFQNDTKTEEAAEHGEVPKEPTKSKIHVEEVLGYCSQRNLECIYNTLYSILPEKYVNIIKLRVGEWDEFKAKTKGYRRERDLLCIYTQNLFRNSEESEIKLSKLFFNEALSTLNKINIENQTRLKNEERRNPTPVDQSEDLTGGKGL